MHCPACGLGQPEGPGFCKRCGKPLAGAQPAPAGAPAISAAAPPPPPPHRASLPPTHAAGRGGRSRTSVINGIASPAVMALVLTVTPRGGEDGGGIAGKYCNADSGETIELKSGGTCYLSDYGLEGRDEVNRA